MSADVVHPDIGLLRWEAAFSYWSAEVRLPGGETLELIVQPDEERPEAFLDRAGELFRWALLSQWRVLREAIDVELLGLYNVTWRREGDPELTADELHGRLGWTFLEVADIGLVPVVFSYAAGDLFGGHSVDVEVDEDLRFRGINLVG